MLGWESMVWAWPLEHFLKVVWSALRGLLATLAIGSDHEQVVAPLLLVFPFSGTIGGAFAGTLILPCLALKAIEDRSDHLFS